MKLTKGGLISISIGILLLLAIAAIDWRIPLYIPFYIGVAISCGIGGHFEYDSIGLLEPLCTKLSNDVMFVISNTVGVLFYLLFFFLIGLILTYISNKIRNRKNR